MYISKLPPKSNDLDYDNLPEWVQSNKEPMAILGAPPALVGMVATGWVVALLAFARRRYTSGVAEMA